MKPLPCIVPHKGQWCVPVGESGTRFQNVRRRWWWPFWTAYGAPFPGQRIGEVVAELPRPTVAPRPLSPSYPPPRTTHTRAQGSQFVAPPAPKAAPVRDHYLPSDMVGYWPTRAPAPEPEVFRTGGGGDYGGAGASGGWEAPSPAPAPSCRASDYSASPSYDSGSSSSSDSSCSSSSSSSSD